MGKWQNTRKLHIQESQGVSLFTAGDYKVARNQPDSMTDKHKTQITNMIPKEAPPWNGQLNKNI